MVAFDHEDKDALWTLVLTNPDGHFTDDNKEYLHWMVANIRGEDIASGETLCDYLQPFPAYGTGYHRYIFVLYRQVRYSTGPLLTTQGSLAKAESGSQLSCTI